MKDVARYRELFVDEAKDAAREFAKKGTLTGWEQVSVEYEARDARQVDGPRVVDVVV